MLPHLLAFVFSLVPSCSECRYSPLYLVQMFENDLSECLDSTRFVETRDVHRLWPRDGAWDANDVSALRDSSACVTDRIGENRYQGLLEAAASNRPFQGVNLDPEFLEQIMRANAADEDSSRDVTKPDPF